MLALAFFSWWYGQGWKTSVLNTFGLLDRINRNFSVSLLLKTLFAPWHRIMSYPGSGIAAYFQAVIDNTISRFVGFWVRLFVLLSALILSIVVIILACIEAVLWPILPLAIIVLVVLGFIK